jgi:hypothetical protein
MSRNGEHPVVVEKLTTEEAGRVREQVERLLASSLFRSSKRCQSLLRLIAERTLAGDAAVLKERTLGVDAFGRAPDYDTNQDPVVRGTAGEIRKKLAQYYQNPEHAGELRISLPLGSYVPEFHTEEAPPAVSPVPAPAPSWWRKRWPVVAAAGALAVVSVAALLLRPWTRSELEQFWRPMLDAPGGVLFCLPQTRVYNFRSDARQNEFEMKVQGMTDAAIAASREPIPMGELIPMWDRYLAWGDVICLVRLTSVFEKRGKPYSIRGKSSTTFSDLRERPAVLIGAFDNEWTLRFVGQLRYTFYKDFQGLEMVRDRDHPEKSDWKVMNSWPQWNISNDYAVVSRVFDRSTDRMIVIAAGITHFGTMGAGEFLSNPEFLGEALPRLPQGWKDKNLQIVLRVPVVHGATGRPHVVATHVW